jgi:hypothetical protein
VSPDVPFCLVPETRAHLYLGQSAEAITVNRDKGSATHPCADKQSKTTSFGVVYRAITSSMILPRNQTYRIMF